MKLVDTSATYFRVRRNWRVWRNLCEIARVWLANGLRLGQNDVLISHEKKERVGAWPWRRGLSVCPGTGRVC
jgi:hypothetical protein